MAETLDSQTFAEMYGPDARVVVGKKGMQMTLGQALQAEALLCEADPTKRQDDSKRLPYLAGMLAAAGSLRPEHEHLVTPAE